MVELIRQSIIAGSLPEDGSSLLASIMQGPRSFVSQEGPIWDFKEQWPASYSDSYFAALARLICAFANTEGGIIIFGVHDKKRTLGCNKVTPDMDRLQQSLSSLLSNLPEMKIRSYFAGQTNGVVVLLVLPIGPTLMPIRFIRRIEKYGPNVIWIREGHQVIHAEPRHVATLYCRSKLNGKNQEDPISGALPPSPATIRRFVGRLDTIDKVFEWLKLSDEPRKFLYGKGGSGKTTIAYEVARVIATDGIQIRLDSEPLSNVIFVTAKQQTLQVMTQKTTEFLGRDFSDERELYAGILTLGNWTSEPVSDFSLDRLKLEVEKFFNVTSNFIVIDDIDTLTTKGSEAGFDFLYRALCRSKRKSKLLYTIRNLPSHSIGNAIEVPGLDDGEYDEFVEVCSNQFRVAAPAPDFAAGRLSEVSERRPLVIETIVALRRTCGSYSQAVQLFEHDAGEDVRRYVFQREWDALKQNGHGRYLLALLAIHKDPLTYEDICALLRYKEIDISDALSEVREMFLQTNEVGNETTFQLGALTRSFVIERSPKLEKYPALEERVKAYKKNFYPENPALSRLRDRVEGLVYQSTRHHDRDALKQALDLVTNSELSAAISEDPRFLCLKAFAYLSQVPPIFEDARRSFKDVFSMKYEPEIEYLRKWFLVERNSGYGTDQCLKIADFVCRGKRYSEDDKLEFISKKANQLYERGKNIIYSDPDQGTSDILSALEQYLTCYANNFASGFSKLDAYTKSLQTCAYFLFNFLASNGRYDSLFDVISNLTGNDLFKFDPLEAPIVQAFELCGLARGSKDEINKLAGRLDHTRRQLIVGSRWNDQQGAARLNEFVMRAVSSLSRKRPAESKLKVVVARQSTVH